jgi:hypothetical protein
VTLLSAGEVTVRAELPPRNAAVPKTGGALRYAATIDPTVVIQRLLPGAVESRRVQRDRL